MQIKNESFWLEWKSCLFCLLGFLFGLVHWTKRKKKPNTVWIGFRQCVSPTGFMSLMFIFALQIHAKPSYDLAGSQLEAMIFISFLAVFLISPNCLLGSPQCPAWLHVSVPSCGSDSLYANHSTVLSGVGILWHFPKRKKNKRKAFSLIRFLQTTCEPPCLLGASPCCLLA